MQSESPHVDDKHKDLDSELEVLMSGESGLTSSAVVTAYDLLVFQEARYLAPS